MTRIIGGDTETFCFDRAFMAPTIVCAQWGLPDGTHGVAVTKDAEDTLAWMLGEHDQIWFHNGVGFDAPAILASYPRLSTKLWDAFERGAFLDTMYLQRMIQIARGELGGPLALDLVCQQWGVPPPTKVIEAVHPVTGDVHDVRTSFGLWYGADSIPDPWYTYADYDGIVQPVLTKRQVEKYCTPKAPGGPCTVRLEDLAQVCRTYFGLALARVYGLRVDTTNVATLANAAHNAIGRLQEAAITNGFLKPVAATRKQLAAGAVAPAQRWCSKRDSKSARTRAAHATCAGCTVQGLDDHGRPDWKLDTKALGAAITEAYDGRPPMTEPKKDKATGRMTGGGTIARSRDVLQDSGDEALEAWSTYNEWSAVVHKDLVMFEQSPIHAGIGVTNNLRPSSFAPNVLNLRRDGFVIATCTNPECGYEVQLSKKDYADMKKDGRLKAGLPCPACESDRT
jgi:hypothetical protein